MSSNAVASVALTPADQAAQYLHCGSAELAGLIKAHGGTLHRIGSDTYCEWDDVNALKAGLPVGSSTTAGSSTTKRTTSRARVKAAQPTPAATAGQSGAKGRKPAKVAAAGKSARPATVDTAPREAAGKAASTPKRKPWPSNPEAEIAELVKLPKQDLLDAAIAYGMAPPYPYRRKPIAEFIVNAKTTMRKAGMVAPGQAGKDELAKRRTSRAGNRDGRAAKVKPVSFSHTGR